MSDFKENWIVFTEFVKIPQTLSNLMVRAEREFSLKHILVENKFGPRIK
jgi:hypothetical protein